jgi:hypothetical protein
MVHHFIPIIKQVGLPFELQKQHLEVADSTTMRKRMCPLVNGCDCKNPIPIATE